MNALLMAVLAVLSAGGAEAQGIVDAGQFAYSAPVNLGDAKQGFVVLKLPGEVVDKLRSDWGDLRLADEEHRIVPYLLRRDESGYWLKSRPLPGVCQGVMELEEGAKGVLVDFGETVDKNRISLQEWMHAPWPLRIDGSDDKEQWQPLTEADYKVQENMDPGNPLPRWLDLKENNFRWLRIVYAADKAPVANTFASPMLADYVPAPNTVGLLQVHLDEVEPVAGTRAPLSPVSVHEWRVDFRNLPVVLTQFVVDDPYFSRAYRLEGSNDGVYWQTLLSGRLNRTRWENHAIDLLVTTRGYLTPARLRLVVEDGDNPPLKMQTPVLWGRTGRIAFDATGRREITLYFGNSALLPPEYDLSQSVRDVSFPKLPGVTLGAIKQRPEKPAPPTPKEERPVLLWVALGLAVCVMLGIVVGAMMGMRRGDTKDAAQDGEDT